MKSLLLAAYFCVCFLIILSVFFQNSRGSQMSAAFSPQTSKNLFGASGPKDFFYTSTKWLIAVFFTLALLFTLSDTRAVASAQQQSWTPLVETSEQSD